VRGLVDWRYVQLALAKTGSAFHRGARRFGSGFAVKRKPEQLYHEIPKLERFFRILTENSLVAHQERLMDNLSLSAEERFDKFCKRYPDIIQRVPQKQIASYIGVTPEFFSK
jgi:CRP-like cAMP-binding protein